MSEEIRMSQPTEERAQEVKRETRQQIKHDAGTPRLALFVWLEDGTCRQVQLSMSDRRVVLETANRKHDFSLRVSSQPVGILWPERADAEKEEG